MKRSGIRFPWGRADALPSARALQPTHNRPARAHFPPMQTIKCVVVGDGAVGKCALQRRLVAVRWALIRGRLAQDMPVDLVHDQQVSERVCPDRV